MKQNKTVQYIYHSIAATSSLFHYSTLLFDLRLLLIITVHKSERECSICLETGHISEGSVFLGTWLYFSFPCGLSQTPFHLWMILHHRILFLLMTTLSADTCGAVLSSHSNQRFHYILVLRLHFCIHCSVLNRNFSYNIETAFTNWLHCM